MRASNVSLATGHGHAAVADLVLVAAAPAAAAADVADPPLLRRRLLLPVGRVAFPVYGKCEIES